MRPWVLAIVVMASGSAVSALPGPSVEIAFSAGRVSVSASDAPVVDVLTAWGKAGHAELAGAPYLGARRITLHLTDAAESDALLAIVGSAGWYSTVARDTPSASESIFQRIAILPAAVTAAVGSQSAAPETLHTYSSDAEMDAAAVAAVEAAARIRPDPAMPRRPADVAPEAFYQYSTPDLPEWIQREPPVNRQPLRLTLGVDPEVLYTYSATTQPVEPLPSSSLFIPDPPALEPEQRYSYEPTPEVPGLTAPKRPSGDADGVPEILVFEGFAGLRLPGRVIRYVSGS